MAKITGVQTGWKGKVGNYVFSMLNGTQIVKTRVIPFNPQSSAQQANRSKLAELALATKGIAKSFISKAWTPTISGNQTTWGNFIKANLANMESNFDITKLVPTHGSVYCETPTSSIYDNSTGQLVLQWSSTPGAPNALETDKVGVLVIDETSSRVVFADSVSAERSEDEAAATISEGLTATNLRSFLFFYRGEWEPGAVTAISDSISMLCSAAA